MLIRNNAGLKMTVLKNFIKWPRYRCILLAVVLLLIFVFQILSFNSFLNISLRRDNFAVNGLQNETEVGFRGEKLIHLDLKGAPPKISYLLKLFPFIKKLGATGILLEYEDTFPYHSGLEDITALNAYTAEDIAAIVDTARINNLMVIPLIPTFGHFEFVLKHRQFKEFRELEENPQALCPSQEKVYSLLKKMIDQVLEAHNTSKYLHIGCDEVEILGLCPKCQKLMRKNKWNKNNIYFNHVKKVAEYIISAHPEVKPIIWSDKFYKRNERTIVSHGIPDLVEVMFWNYKPDRSFFPKEEDMLSFAKLFKVVWIANAFKVIDLKILNASKDSSSILPRNIFSVNFYLDIYEYEDVETQKMLFLGATGSTRIVTNIEYHLRNTKEWMYFVQKWKSQLNFKGVALTGWQRYNHFMALCELLPVGIPSLALNLLFLNQDGLDDDQIKHSLGCNEVVPIAIEDIEDLTLLSKLKCDFPGFKIYQKIHYYYISRQQVKKALKRLERGEFTFYNILHNTSNPTYFHQLNRYSYEQRLVELDDLEEEIQVALEEVYDESTIKEWITTHVMPVRLRLQAAINVIKAVSSVREWPKRPLVNKELQVKKMFSEICGNNEMKGCTFFNIHF